MLKAYLHPKKKPNDRHWYAYDVVFDGEIIVTDSRDPDRPGQAEVENIRKLITAAATATTLLAGSVIWKAEAAPATGVGSMPPLTKSYSPFEGVGCRCGPYTHRLRYNNYPWRRPFLLQRIL